MMSGQLYTSTQLKLIVGGDCFRLVRFPGSYAELEEIVRSRFESRLPENFCFKYEDSEKDSINIESQSDFEAFAEFCMYEKRHSISIRIDSKSFKQYFSTHIPAAAATAYSPPASAATSQAMPLPHSQLHQQMQSQQLHQQQQQSNTVLGALINPFITSYQNIEQQQQLLQLQQSQQQQQLSHQQNTRGSNKFAAQQQQQQQFDVLSNIHPLLNNLIPFMSHNSLQQLQGSLIHPNQQYPQQNQIQQQQQSHQTHSQARNHQRQQSSHNQIQQQQQQQYNGSSHHHHAHGHNNNNNNMMNSRTNSIQSIAQLPTLSKRASEVNNQSYNNNNNNNNNNNLTNDHQNSALGTTAITTTTAISGQNDRSGQMRQRNAALPILEPTKQSSKSMQMQEINFQQMSRPSPQVNDSATHPYQNNHHNHHHQQQGENSRHHNTSHQQCDMSFAQQGKSTSKPADDSSRQITAVAAATPATIDEINLSNHSKKQLNNQQPNARNSAAAAAPSFLEQKDTENRSTAPATQQIRGNAEKIEKNFFESELIHPQLNISPEKNQQHSNEHVDLGNYFTYHPKENKDSELSAIATVTTVVVPPVTTGQGQMGFLGPYPSAPLQTNTVSKSHFEEEFDMLQGKVSSRLAVSSNSYVNNQQTSTTVSPSISIANNTSNFQNRLSTGISPSSQILNNFVSAQTAAKQIPCEECSCHSKKLQQQQCTIEGSQPHLINPVTPTGAEITPIGGENFVTAGAGCEDCQCCKGSGYVPQEPIESMLGIISSVIQYKLKESEFALKGSTIRQQKIEKIIPKSTMDLLKNALIETTISSIQHPASDVAVVATATPSANKINRSSSSASINNWACSECQYVSQSNQSVYVCIECSQTFSSEESNGAEQQQEKSTTTNVISSDMFLFNFTETKKTSSQKVKHIILCEGCEEQHTLTHRLVQVQQTDTMSMQYFQSSNAISMISAGSSSVRPSPMSSAIRADPQPQQQSLQTMSLLRTSIQPTTSNNNNNNNLERSLRNSRMSNQSYGMPNFQTSQTMFSNLNMIPSNTNMSGSRGEFMQLQQQQQEYNTTQFPHASAISRSSDVESNRLSSSIRAQQQPGNSGALPPVGPSHMRQRQDSKSSTIVISNAPNNNNNSNKLNWTDPTQQFKTSDYLGMNSTPISTATSTVTKADSQRIAGQLIGDQTSGGDGGLQMALQKQSQQQQNNQLLMVSQPQESNGRNSSNRNVLRSRGASDLSNPFVSQNSMQMSNNNFLNSQGPLTMAHEVSSMTAYFNEEDPLTFSDARLFDSKLVPMKMQSEFSLMQQSGQPVGVNNSSTSTFGGNSQNNITGYFGSERTPKAALGNTAGFPAVKEEEYDGIGGMQLVREMSEEAKEADIQRAQLLMGGGRNYNNNSDNNNNNDEFDGINGGKIIGAGNNAGFDNNNNNPLYGSLEKPKITFEDFENMRQSTSAKKSKAESYLLDENLLVSQSSHLSQAAIIALEISSESRIISSKSNENNNNDIDNNNNNNEEDNNNNNNINNEANDPQPKEQSLIARQNVTSVSVKWQYHTAASGSSASGPGVQPKVSLSSSSNSLSSSMTMNRLSLSSSLLLSQSSQLSNQCQAKLLYSYCSRELLQDSSVVVYLEILNSGTENWPDDVFLRCISGITDSNQYPIKSVNKGEVVSLAIQIRLAEMKLEKGETYRTSWRLYYYQQNNEDRKFFGPKITIEFDNVRKILPIIPPIYNEEETINVVQDITKQMLKFIFAKDETDLIDSFVIGNEIFVTDYVREVQKDISISQILITFIKSYIAARNCVKEVV